MPGLPTEKLSFWTVPMRMAINGAGAGDDLTVKSLMDALNDPSNRGVAVRQYGLQTDDTFLRQVDKFLQPKPRDQQLKDLETLLFMWNIEWSSYSSRVIGRALKGAGPGMAFDIMLHRAV